MNLQEYLQSNDHNLWWKLQAGEQFNLFEDALERIDALEEKNQEILGWCDAYPLEMFPEPDLKQIAKVLKDNGLILDAVSASNMRHVLKGIKRIIEK